MRILSFDLVHSTTTMYFKFLLNCLALLVSSIRGFGIESPKDVFELTTKVFGFVLKSWDIADKVEERVTDHANEPQLWFTKKKERNILYNLEQITRLVHMIQMETDDLRFIMLGTLKKLQSMPNAVLNGIQVNELLESVRSIENDFKTMEGYKIGGDDNNDNNVNPAYTSYTLEKFADAMLSFLPGAPHKLLSKIHSFIVPEWDGFDFHTHGGIFNILKDTLFTHSSIDRDVAQTTLPFIDIQEVAPYPGVPLSGVGIYYKGTKHFGGFIGANVFTYDFSNDIKPELFNVHSV